MAVSVMFILGLTHGMFCGKFQAQLRLIDTNYPVTQAEVLHDDFSDESCCQPT